MVCVSSLLRDRRGTLWIGAGGELIRYRDGLFERRVLVETVHASHAVTDAMMAARDE